MIHRFLTMWRFSTPDSHVFQGPVLIYEFIGSPQEKVKWLNMQIQSYLDSAWTVFNGVRHEVSNILH